MRVAGLLVLVCALVGCGPCVERGWVYHPEQTTYVLVGKIMIPMTDPPKWSCDCLARASKGEPVADVQVCAVKAPTTSLYPSATPR